MAVKVFLFRHSWQAFSKDKFIHDVVRGKVLDFDLFPVQCELPRPLTLSIADREALDNAMLTFIQQKVVEKCSPISDSGFYSNVFPTRKKDGTARVIFNLKELNDFVKHVHFKMSTIKEVLSLLQENCFFITIDFKDAYFSVRIQSEDRKWLRFMWKNQSFQFTCLPQGLTSAPRIFTKLLKPILSHLRKLGILIVCYIDDCILLASSAQVLEQNAMYALQTFDSVGLTVNVNKSILSPTQEVEFLGIILNSVAMTASLPSRRKESIKTRGLSLLRDKPTIHDLAAFIGLAVASEAAVNLAPLRYKYLEIVRNRELTLSKGNYNSVISLDSHAQDMIRWWIDNIDSQTKSLVSCPPELEIHTDACLTGWGAKVGDARTGGHWAHVELDHINCLELKAILLSLKSLCKRCEQTHIRLRSDNSTAIACINRCGSTKLNLNTLTEQIFDWAAMREITLSAEYIRGIDNVEADAESRVRNIDTEWMLLPCIFKRLCEVFFSPDIDLFASHINAQTSSYVSWKPDPYASFTNAFTFHWSNLRCYAFPPFSVIGRMVRKILEDRATSLAILPLWPNQTWFPMALQLLAAPPLLLPRASLVLPQDPSRVHPQTSKLILSAMILSGDPLRTEAFRRKLPNFCFSHGDRARNRSMGHISKDGCLFVSSGKLILFNNL